MFVCGYVCPLCMDDEFSLPFSYINLVKGCVVLPAFDPWSEEAWPQLLAIGKCRHGLCVSTLHILECVWFTFMI